MGDDGRRDWHRTARPSSLNVRAVDWIASMKTIWVALADRGYPVIVGQGILEQAGKIFERRGFSSPPIVISTARILKLHGGRLLKSIENKFGPAVVIRIG